MHTARRIIWFLFLFTAALNAAPPIYVVMWFDTEDYVDAASDDAALRIATDLTNLGVPATFKVVGEKARVLEARGRKDVIQALSKHTIGYHSNMHSAHPTPAEYLQRFSFLEGAAEFERREGAGARDVSRLFGKKLACYGQPGSSWAPQANLALRRIGIPVYLDEGEQVGLDSQPFWFGGMLYVFNMGQNQFRARLDAGPEDKEAYATFDKAVARLRAAGGGLISIYYHPTEFVNTEFWDAVNFAHGANPPREQWKSPNPRTKQDSERCYQVLRKFVQHMKSVPDVQFITAADLPDLYATPDAAPPDRKTIATHLRNNIVFLSSNAGAYSPADMLLALLGVPAQVVDGPTAAGVTTFRSATIPRNVLDRAVRDVSDFIARNHRLPNEVFIGAETVSLADFTATLADATLTESASVPVTRGRIAFERYFSNDAAKSFDWIIHPAGFAPNELLDIARLQGWTLKPARLRSATR